MPTDCDTGKVATTTWRIELKFPFSSPALALLALRNCGLALRPSHPPRTVTTLYLDTPSPDAYRAVVEALDERKKTRIRWYPGTPAQAVLELKVRRGILVGKKRLELGFCPEAAAAGAAPALRVSRAARRRFPALAAGCVPAAATSYTRSYFATPDGLVRATVDTKISLEKISPLPVEQPAAALPYAAACVVEIKLPPDPPESMLAPLGLGPAVSISKYRMAVEFGRTGGTITAAR